MKRVLHIIYGMNAGGMESMIMNYYRKIDKNKFQFDFLINDYKNNFYEDEIKKMGGKIFRITPRNKNVIKNHNELKKFFKMNNYDIVHIHQGITYYYPLKMAKKYGVKRRIIHNHGINRKYLKYLRLYSDIYLKKRICKMATDYIACSENVLDNLFTPKIICKNNYTILNNSIDVSKFKYNENYRKEIRHELNINKNDYVIVHIGTFTPPKNHMFLVDVFIKNLNYHKNMKLILVGDGPLKKSVKDYVELNKISKYVIFLNSRKDIYKIMSASDLMVFPSVYEGLPLTVIEAQSNGLKIIMSKNITKQVQLTNLIRTEAISNINNWKFDITKDYDRNMYNDVIKKSVYNIDNAVTKLEEIYNKNS